MSRWGGRRSRWPTWLSISKIKYPYTQSTLCIKISVWYPFGYTLTPSEFLTFGTILGCSLGLITESFSTVQLVHFTLREYLSNNPTLFQSPHSMIAEACLTYLNFQCVRQLSQTDISASFTFSLLRYASCYWGKHIRREKTEGLTQPSSWIRRAYILAVAHAILP